MSEEEGYPDTDEPAASELMVMQGRKEEKERVIQQIETDFPEQADKILSSLYNSYSSKDRIVEQEGEPADVPSRKEVEKHVPEDVEQVSGVQNNLPTAAYEWRYVDWEEGHTVLCHECSKKLNQIRSRLNPCPNCGQGAGQNEDEEGYRCRNRNCRVKYFASEGQDKMYEKILEERGIEVPQ